MPIAAVITDGGYLQEPLLSFFIAKAQDSICNVAGFAQADEGLSIWLAGPGWIIGAGHNSCLLSQIAGL